MNQPLSSLSVPQLRQAIVIREKMEALEKQLAAILGGTPAAVPAEPRKKRKMSPEARARIGAAQKARWAKQKGAKPSAAAPKAKTKAEPKKKRKITTAGRRHLAELAKARWAKIKAAGKSSLKAG